MKNFFVRHFLMIFLSVWSLLITGCGPQQSEKAPAVQTQPFRVTADAFTMNRRLARTVNLGNALEAPREGEWGMVICKHYLDSLAAAGFTAVRIPIKWSAHAEKAPPYTVDPAFFSRIDEVTAWCRETGLNAILDFQHYNGLVDHPQEHKERWLAIWQQISRHYKEAPDSIFFELLNEPHEPLTASLWNRYLAEAVEVIRRDNPARILIVGPVYWNGFERLADLHLPDDSLLIVTFHYYHPFHFTHQGASWVPGSDPWLGTTWQGTPEEKQTIVRDFDTVAAWSRLHHRPVFLGEFGAYSKADLPSRLRWTAFVRETAGSKGFSWGYWEFGAGFGIYDREQNRWRENLLRALIPEKGE